MNDSIPLSSILCFPYVKPCGSRIRLIGSPLINNGPKILDDPSGCLKIGIEKYVGTEVV